MLWLKTPKDAYHFYRSDALILFSSISFTGMRWILGEQVKSVHSIVVRRLCTPARITEYRKQNQMSTTLAGEKVTFPDDFTWGAATASFQIEGATHDDGRGQSIWDTFCRVPDAVVNGDTGDVACDHYHLYKEDIDLMAELGLKAYRFSIAWPRILPQGTGTINEAGLDFYDRLVDTVLAKGIEPYATLYHWDLPQALEDKGGWLNRDTIDAFVNYTDAITKVLGDRIHNWITLNEPWCAAYLGYGLGVHAPGKKNWAEGNQACHHLMVAHGKAVPVIRTNGDAQTRVGIALNPTWVDAISDSPEDKAAAYRVDGGQNRWFLDPLYKGSYPEDMLALYGPIAPKIEAGDMETIAAPTDFLGINYYSRAVVGAGDGNDPANIRNVKPEGEYTAMDWEVYAPGIYNLLMRIHRDYAPKALYVTENGAAFDDVMEADGTVHDDRRQAFLEGYIGQVGRAAQDGAPVKGYFVWSLMDNFEWSFGYDKRFGIIYVDYKTLKRTPKQSARWYSDAIRENGFVPVG